MPTITTIAGAWSPLSRGMEEVHWNVGAGGVQPQPGAMIARTNTPLVMLSVTRYGPVVGLEAAAELKTSMKKAPNPGERKFVGVWLLWISSRGRPLTVATVV